ncbi:MAG TPA: alpha/beta fold hydrolase [Blastocatellia bacterium]|nr:alpha/beta fold hydrolase [Blastocatellia bacterium]
MTNTTLIAHRPDEKQSGYQQQKNKTAIVFVHGYGGDPKKTWGNFPDLLKNDARLNGWDIYSVGYTTGFWFDLIGIWKADPDLDALALMLRTIANLSPLDEYKQLAFIAHSMGGLIVQRALVEYDELTQRVSHLFLFGTPSNGLTKSIYFKFWKRQLDDMAEGGEFINELRDKWEEKIGDHPPFEFWVVAGDQDEFVPRSSSLEPFPPERQAVVLGDHLQIVKPVDAKHLGVKLVLKGLIGKAAASGPGNASRVAIEKGEFRETVKLLEPIKDELDEQGLVRLALALEGVGRQEDAIKVLAQAPGSDYTDAAGVLAGRLKRRWLVEHKVADAETAQSLYQEAYNISLKKGNHAQAYYHGINVAFMKLAYGGNHTEASNMAIKVLEHCSKSPEDFWRYATEGEAYLLLRDTGKAIACYKRAINADHAPMPRQVDSMYKQAIRVASILGDMSAGTRLIDLFNKGN